MTATTMQDLLANLDDVVLQKTLSLDAYKSLTQLKERATQTDAENQRLKEQVVSRDTAIAKLEQDLSQASEKLNAIATRERAVTSRETKVTELEIAAAVSAAEARTFRHCLGVVFAPNTVRESVQKYGSAPGGNGMSVSTSDYGTVQATQGYNNPDSPGAASNPGDRSHLG